MDSPAQADTPEEDVRLYKERSHSELIRLTRAMWRIPFGALTDLHKVQAAKLGATSPSTVFLRSIILARLVAAQERGGGRP